MSNDESIIKELKRNPPEGFRHLMRVYNEPVYWHIRRMVICHDDAQDATQETFVRIFRSAANMDKVQSLKAWIYKIATHEALRLIERRRNDNLSIEDSAMPLIQIYADDYLELDRQAEIQLQEAILSLPRKQQLTFSLRYYDELTYSEIGSICGTTAVGAKMNYHLAKEKIIKYIKTHRNE